MPSSRQSSSNNLPTEPSLIKGHAKFVGGAVRESIGSRFGMRSIEQPGEQSKRAGKLEMQLAESQRNVDSSTDPNSWTAKAQAAFGYAVGCRGLQNKTGNSSSSSGSRRGAHDE